MRKTIIVFCFLTALYYQSSCQTLKASVGFGGAGANKSYIYNSFYGPYVINGQYEYEVNVSYPFIGKGFGLFIETNNRFVKFETGNILLDLSFRSSNYIGGVCWRKLLGKTEIELLLGYGYEWDKYKLTKTELYTVSNELAIYHGGATFYFPVFDFMDAIIGARITLNKESHISTSFYSRREDFEIPSTVYSGLAGLSFRLFGSDN